MPYPLCVDDLTRGAVDRVLDAWARVSAPWKARAEAQDEVSEMCILATGACASVLQEEFGLTVSVLPVDLYAWNEQSEEFEPRVEHPDGSSAVQGDSYVGHVVAVVEDGARSYIVDAELEVVAPFNGRLAKAEVGGQRYMYRPRTEHQQFSTTNAWEMRTRAAAHVSSALAGGQP